ncbi:glycosyltransferase [Luteococcus sp.]|uniref:glycosyltransferase n=1 Tax=Luteococcus sp. TaxID=1969402 RepID=UPI00373603D4
MNHELTVIVPCWNAAEKLAPCLASLDSLHASVDLEVVFVDDASTDATPDALEAYCRRRPWARLERFSMNTGGPSTPRNRGIEGATGTYVFFLDIDDEVLTEGVLASLAVARETGADVVRAPLVRVDARGELLLNTLPAWDSSLTRRERIEMIVARQSTTVCGLIRHSLLVDHEIRWESRYRMGEDTLFWFDVYSHADTIEYSDVADLRYITNSANKVKSSTQQYQARELADHLGVWRGAQERLARVGLDYFALRGQVALQSVFVAMRRYNQGGFTRDEFDQLRDFLRRHEKTVRAFRFNARNKALASQILDDDYFGFLEGIKLRLLVAGMDLKFIAPALSALRDKFQVQVDQWDGHDEHDEERSRRLLDWADIIHAEWMLGNAVWYSQNRRPHQKLVIRLHRFELTRDFGDRLERDAVDRIVCVSVPTLQDALGRFGFDRSNMRVLPNLVDVDNYRTCDDPEKVFNLALVGSVGANKGYHRALELLAELHQLDVRYNLTVYGKLPSELPWLMRDDKERAYFETCSRFVAERGLESAVHFAGWTDTSTALADKGFVLSTSDFESFHVAPAEAFACGNIGLFLPWRGVEYIHPNKYICRDVAQMRDRILALRDLDTFTAEAQEGVAFVRENFSLERFVADYTELIHGLIDERVG